MGMETKCLARCEDQLVTGKLHLDSTALSFSGAGLKWSLELGTGVKTKEERGWLVVWRGKKQAAFELGAAAAKWAQKILHPPSRAKKLGLKAGLRCWLASKFPAEFVLELAAAGATTTKRHDECQLGFLLLEKKEHLAKLVTAANLLRPKVSLWVVWPKGDTELTQAEVMKCAADCGMGPSKVAAFDSRLTAMRFAKK
jgi:hypothetical protein